MLTRIFEFNNARDVAIGITQDTAERPWIVKFRRDQSDMTFGLTLSNQVSKVTPGQALPKP